MLPLERLTQSVVTIAKTAGQFISTEAESFDDSKIEFKGSSDLVSYVDKESEKMIVDALSELLPEASFIAEEGSAPYDESASYFWVVDPLDGTTNFANGIPAYSVSIALATKDDVLLGVVYEVSRHECFYAYKGGGAYLNGKKIQVSAEQDIQKSMIGTGFPYDVEDKLEPAFRIIKNLVTESQGVRRFGSAAVDLCFVACGRFGAYFEFNLQPYDVAAGMCIVREAGGHAVDFKGSSEGYSGKQILAAGPILSEMLARINAEWPKG